VVPVLRTLLPALAGRVVAYLKVTGLGESDIVERVEADLEARCGEDLEMGYCLGRGDVDVRLAGTAAAVDLAAQLVRDRLGDFIISEDRRLLEQVVVDRLRESGQWVALAESCTGGMIANRITDVSGASAVLGYGFVSYANEAKQKLLAVPAELLQLHGAVSEAVALAMAEGCLKVSGADHALAVTGIAGPGGGTPAKPVGTVFVALASRKKSSVCRKLFFPGGRDRFKLLTSQAALDLLRRRLFDLPEV
jgi:nicotinamide-nucleotide amidase